MKKPDLAFLRELGNKVLPLAHKYRALLIVLLAGVLLLASGGLFGGRQQLETAAEPDAAPVSEEGFPSPPLKRI